MWLMEMTMNKCGRRLRRRRGRPKCIIARTVKGKGVSFMENGITGIRRGTLYQRAIAEIEDREKHCNK